MTSSAPAVPATRALFDALLDDAAVFPPGDEPLPSAVAAHLRRRTGPDGPFAGPFLCGSARWDELVAALVPEQVLDLALVVTGGPTAVEDAVARASGEPRVALAGVEVACDGSAAAVDELLAVLTDLPAGVVGSLEVPLGPGLPAAAARVAGTGCRLKLRTGGLRAAAFPGVDELATALHACVQAAVPVKLTAGLHAAVRHRDDATGFEHHGFLNVLVAVGDALDGAGPDRLAQVLGETDGARLSRTARGLDPSAVRATFTSFGTCSSDEPLADLRALGLLA